MHLVCRELEEQVERMRGRLEEVGEVAEAQEEITDCQYQVWRGGGAGYESRSLLKMNFKRRLSYCSQQTKNH